METRLDRLESLMADHQAQFQRERAHWQEEKHILREERAHWQEEKQILREERAHWQEEKQILVESFHLLQGDVQALQREKAEMRGEMEALQNAHTPTQETWTATGTRGQGDDPGDVRLQPASKSSRTIQQSLKDRIAEYAAPRLRPAEGGAGEGNSEEAKQTPGARTGQARLQSGKPPGDLAHKTEEHTLPLSWDPTRHANDPHPARLFPHRADLAAEATSHAQHVRAVVRSDDSDPLDAVTSQLAQRMTEVTADIQALKDSDVQQRQDIQAAGASTFVQWGSSSCTGGSSQLVYSGAVGGSLHTHTGAAANFLCLSMSPKLRDTSPGVPYTLLYGGEYETHDAHYDTDPVCAVCRASQPTTIMLPGTDVCGAGWTLQYSGFLMAGYYSHPGATEFICVDSRLESAAHSQHDDNGHLLYFTTATCGSLPCPPYHDGKVVTCAVCSK